LKEPEGRPRKGRDYWKKTSGKEMCLQLPEGKRTAVPFDRDEEI